MAVLLYCLAHLLVRPKRLQTGVAGNSVERVEAPRLAAFISRSADSNVWLRAPLRTSALEFHRVLMEFGARLRVAVASVVREWGDGMLKNGQRHLALVERSKVAEFERVLRGLPVPERTTVRVSGPWPVSEFLGTVKNVGM